MSKAPRPLFKRVVVKLSGEALMGPDTHGLHAPTLQRIAGDLKAAADLGVQVAVVVGGGNFFRGLQGADKGIERARADSIGMLATVMNALAMEGALEQIGQPARVLSAVAMPSLCQPYSRQAALAHLVKHRVIILAGGTGNPFFTTDTGAALRAAELSCDAVMKATQVDGIYTADPKKDPTRDALRSPQPRRSDRPQPAGDGHRGFRACARQRHPDRRLLGRRARRDSLRAPGQGAGDLRHAVRGVSGLRARALSVFGHSGLAQVVEILLLHRLADRHAGFRQDRMEPGP